MKLFRRMKRNRRCFGWRGIWLALRELATRAPLALDVWSPHLQRPVRVRLNTTDISIYHQMFVECEYEIALARAPRVIVDAGANIGLSVAYFAQRYPGARIVAIEPEPSNYELLVHNTRGLADVTALECALWSEATELDLFDTGTGRAGLQKDGFLTFAQSAKRAEKVGKVRAIDLDTLVREQGLDHIDLLKIDIEGAERDVFAKGSEWIDRVNVIFAELHDRLRPGCSRAFYAATQRLPEEIHRGENVIVARSGCLAPQAVHR